MSFLDPLLNHDDLLGAIDYDENCPEGNFGNCRTPGDKTCWHCGEPGLWWKKTKDGWKLWDFDGQHVCKEMEVKE
jgi:hypothetical protein